MNNLLIPSRAIPSAQEEVPMGVDVVLVPRHCWTGSPCPPSTLSHWKPPRRLEAIDLASQANVSPAVLYNPPKILF